MAETREFTVHPAILHSVILAQAGTLAKGLCEAFMNAVDAGATKFNATLDAKEFIVEDNGRGFQSREEIENWFECFGTPHEEGDATYGKFRMGRGQLMAFARTIWRTGAFEMDADIKNKGLNYDLKDGLKKVKGCSITGILNKELELYELNDALREFTELVRFGQIPVTLNGKVITKKVNSIKWDVETDDFYIKLDSSSELKVYNLGVLVRGYGSYRFGSGGVVVSKRPFKVNFARNDILSGECDIWPNVVKMVKAKSATKVAKKSVMTDYEREFLVKSMMAGSEIGETLRNAKVITTGTGSHVTVSTMAYAGLPYTTAEKGDRLAERLHRAKVAFVVSRETLDRFNMDTLDELLEKLSEQARSANQYWIADRLSTSAVPLAKLAQGYSKDYTLIPLQEATDIERMAFKQLQTCNSQMGQWMQRYMANLELKETHSRDVKLGQSDVALAWTNGRDTITVDRKFLVKCAKGGVDGWLRLMAVMVHEYCHDTADLDGHSHPMEFYEMFETVMTNGIPVATWAGRAANLFGAAAMKAGIRLSRANLESASILRKQVSLDEPIEPEDTPFVEPAMQTASSLA
jgi:hypothetical protein